jgi:hypothetical protein
MSEYRQMMEWLSKPLNAGHHHDEPQPAPPSLAEPVRRRIHLDGCTAGRSGYSRECNKNALGKNGSPRKQREGRTPAGKLPSLPEVRKSNCARPHERRGSPGTTASPATTGTIPPDATYPMAYALNARRRRYVPSSQSADGGPPGYKTTWDKRNAAAKPQPVPARPRLIILPRKSSKRGSAEGPAPITRRSSLSCSGPSCITRNSASRPAP